LLKNVTQNYSLLPFGGSDVDKVEWTSTLMNGEPFGALMKLCRRQFDVVIIDGPPVMESRHARLFARYADLAVIVAEWGKTNSSEVTETVDRLGLDDVVLFLNKVDVARLRLTDPQQARRVAAAAAEFDVEI
jgi:Mrp family chromosome partitioning ATPase